MDNDGDVVHQVPKKVLITRVDSVHFEGLERTKRDIVRELVKPIFNTQDLGEVLKETLAVRQRFRELGLFRNVQVSIDESNKPPPEGSKHANLSITFDVEETRRYTGGIFTSAGNNAASLMFELRSPNLLGRGEELKGNYEQSLKYHSTWSATFSKPLVKSFLPALNSRFDVTVLQSSKDNHWSHFKELDRGFFADLCIQQSAHNFHFLRWESSWRYLSSTDLDLAFKIREQLGHSLKSSISHTYTYDRRDNPVLPTSGFLFKLFNEYAGFHKEGGASFLKQEVELQQNASISKLILQGSLKLGLLSPFSNVLLIDKFFLGGPLNLRGFQQNGVGPHTHGSALGANAYWVGGGHLYLPLPFKNNFNEYLRVHAFLNAGNIADVDNYNLLLNNTRVSSGLGLVMSFGRVRFEINYCVPIRNQPEDKAQKGLQFGVGIEYT